MDFELAKKLKQAGFGKDCKGVLPIMGRWVTQDNEPIWDLSLLKKEDIYIPTLEELIEAFNETKIDNDGDEYIESSFGMLRMNLDEWIAHPSDDYSYIKEGGRYSNFVGKGKTPIEAVAELWLKLNK